MLFKKTHRIIIDEARPTIDRLKRTRIKVVIKDIITVNFHKGHGPYKRKMERRYSCS